MQEQALEPSSQFYLLLHGEIGPRDYLRLSGCDRADLAELSARSTYAFSPLTDLSFFQLDVSQSLVERVDRWLVARRRRDLLRSLGLLRIVLQLLLGPSLFEWALTEACCEPRDRSMPPEVSAQAH